MDATPFVFRDRVAALWKCCEYRTHGYGCVARRVPVCEWRREMTRISLQLHCEGGQWKYGFCYPTDTGSCLTLEQMRKSVNLEHVTIEAIEMWDIDDDNLTNLGGDDVERLMKLIVCLSSEPQLDLTETTAEIFNTPIGSTLLKCLSRIQFTSIQIREGNSVYNQLLGNQFSRRNPTEICLYSVDLNRKFFMKNLKNGRIKRFYTNSYYYGAYRLRAEVMEGIVNSFLKNPEEYKEGHFRISAFFDGSTKAVLKRKLKEGFCEKDFYGRYCFTEKLRGSQLLCVEKCDSSRYLCTLEAL